MNVEPGSEAKESAYHIRTAHDIVMITFTRPPNSADLLEAAPEIQRIGLKRRLWDLRSGLDFTGNEARIIAALLASKVKIPESRYAFVVSSAAHYGMCRLFSAYYDSENASGNVFYALDEAIVWLHAEQACVPSRNPASRPTPSSS